MHPLSFIAATELLVGPVTSEIVRPDLHASAYAIAGAALLRGLQRCVLQWLICIHCRRGSGVSGTAVVSAIACLSEAGDRGSSGATTPIAAVPLEFSGFGRMAGFAFWRSKPRGKGPRPIVWTHAS